MVSLPISLKIIYTAVQLRFQGFIYQWGVIYQLLHILQQLITTLPHQYLYSPPTRLHCNESMGAVKPRQLSSVPTFLLSGFTVMGVRALYNLLTTNSKYWVLLRTEVMSPDTQPYFNLYVVDTLTNYTKAKRLVGCATSGCGKRHPLSSKVKERTKQDRDQETTDGKSSDMSPVETIPDRHRSVLSHANTVFSPLLLFLYCKDPRYQIKLINMGEKRERDRDIPHILLFTFTVYFVLSIAYCKTTS